MGDDADNPMPLAPFCISRIIGLIIGVGLLVCIIIET